MDNLKYELLSNDTVMHDDVTLYRIKAVRNFSNVRVGDVGGYIQAEYNLSHDGDAWVSGDAKVSGYAWVYEDAWVYGNAQISGDAWVYKDAQVSGDAWVYGNAKVSA